MLETILLAIVIGAVIGTVARLLMPGQQNIGTVMTVLLGIIGFFLGHFLTQKFGDHTHTGAFAILPFAIGVIAAIVLIALYLGTFGRRHRTVVVEEATIERDPR